MVLKCYYFSSGNEMSNHISVGGEMHIITLREKNNAQSQCNALFFHPISFLAVKVSELKCIHRKINYNYLSYKIVNVCIKTVC